MESLTLDVIVFYTFIVATAVSAGLIVLYTSKIKEAALATIILINAIAFLFITGSMILRGISTQEVAILISMIISLIVFKIITKSIDPRRKTRVKVIYKDKGKTVRAKNKYNSRSIIRGN